MSGTARRSVAARPQKPCSDPPNRPTGAYDRRPGPGPGRRPRRPALCASRICVLTELRGVAAAQRAGCALPQARLLTGMSYSSGVGTAESGHLVPNWSERQRQRRQVTTALDRDHRLTRHAKCCRYLGLGHPQLSALLPAPVPHNVKVPLLSPDVRYLYYSVSRGLPSLTSAHQYPAVEPVPDGPAAAGRLWTYHANPT
jgi:hypothetical protein